MDASKIKSFITEPNWEIRLRPLLLFRGGLTPVRAKTCWNFLRASMEAELPNMTCITEASSGLNDPAHLCGFHAKSGWQRMGMLGFFSRVLQSPAVLKQEPRLKDYIYWVVDQTHMARLFTLDRIPETNIWSTRDWRRPPKAPRKQREGIAEFYPFITSTPTKDHELLLAVERLVPKAIPSDVRADICQDILVAILTGEQSLENIKDATPQFVKRLYREMPSRYGHLSLETPMFYSDGKSRTLGETIV